MDVVCETCQSSYLLCFVSNLVDHSTEFPDLSKLPEVYWDLKVFKLCPKLCPYHHIAHRTPGSLAVPHKSRLYSLCSPVMNAMDEFIQGYCSRGFSPFSWNAVAGFFFFLWRRAKLSSLVLYHGLFTWRTSLFSSRMRRNMWVTSSHHQLLVKAEKCVSPTLWTHDCIFQTTLHYLSRDFPQITLILVYVPRTDFIRILSCSGAHSWQLQ